MGHRQTEFRFHLLFRNVLVTLHVFSIMAFCASSWTHNDSCSCIRCFLNVLDVILVTDIISDIILYAFCCFHVLRSFCVSGVSIIIIIITIIYYILSFLPPEMLTQLDGILPNLLYVIYAIYECSCYIACF